MRGYVLLIEWIGCHAAIQFYATALKMSGLTQNTSKQTQWPSKAF